MNCVLYCAFLPYMLVFLLKLHCRSWKLIVYYVCRLEKLYNYQISLLKIISSHLTPMQCNVIVKNKRRNCFHLIHKNIIHVFCFAKRGIYILLTSWKGSYLFMYFVMLTKYIFLIGLFFSTFSHIFLHVFNESKLLI